MVNQKAKFKLSEFHQYFDKLYSNALYFNIKVNIFIIFQDYFEFAMHFIYEFVLIVSYIIFLNKNMTNCIEFLIKYILKWKIYSNEQ